MRGHSASNFIRIGSLLLTALFCWGSLEAGAADLPRIGIIDFYGLGKLRVEEIRRALTVKAGDLMPVRFQPGLSMDEVRRQLGTSGTLPADAREIESALGQVSGVARVQVSSICCEPDGTATLFVGVQETNTTGFVYRVVPEGAARLPQKQIALYDGFMESLSDAVRLGTAQEDDSQGHALFSGEVLKLIQDEIIRLANDETSLLEGILASSADSKHRAVAAWFLGYANDKQRALRVLLPAVRDPEELVRNNATRAIGAIAALAVRRRDLGIEIRPDEFIDMLRSISWSDRNKATMVLERLTEARTPHLLEELRKRALPELIEMGRWKDSHSLGPLLIVGRIAGLEDGVVQDLWKAGRREEVIRKASAGREAASGQ